MKTTAAQYAKALLTVTDGKSGKALDGAVKDFVALLTERHEMFRWREIVRAFDNAWRRKYGAANVTIETATKPSRELLAAFVKLYPEATITSVLNPELMGGARVQIDDRLLDGSVSGQLNRLKEELYG